MSDTENKDSPPSIEKDIPMESTIKDGEKESSINEQMTAIVDSPPSSEPNSPSKSPDATHKKIPSKSPKKKIVPEDSDVEEEELPLGLLERPVIIESGKRERKKTDRLPAGEGFTPGQKKKLEIPEGRGTKLGECPRIEFKLQHNKAEDLKLLHRLLFVRQGTANEIKKNIRLFCGFSFDNGDKEHDKRMITLNKLTMAQLKFVCDILDLERSGQKTDVVSRLMNFLLNPVNSGKPLPKPKQKKSSAGKKSKGEKRKRSTKKEVKKKKSKEDVELSEDDDDDEQKETTNDDDSGNEDEAQIHEDEESDSDKEEEPPKKKKQRIKSPKIEKPKKVKKSKENGKKDKMTPQKKMQEVADSDESSDDEPLSKISSDPPDNDEIKEVIKKILEGADLEEVTMKTVVKQVYAKYPSFDLSDKKDFIKSTVKQIIS